MIIISTPIWSHINKSNAWARNGCMHAEVYDVRLRVRWGWDSLEYNHAGVTFKAYFSL